MKLFLGLFTIFYTISSMAIVNDVNACVVFDNISTSETVFYIDPGTLSIILQALIGGLVAGITAISIFWKKVKVVLSNIFSKKTTNSNK